MQEFVPQLHSYSLTAPMFIKYEKINIPTLHYYFCNDAQINWTIVIDLYKKLLHNFSIIKPKNFDYALWKDALIDIYLTKTIVRLLQISSNEFFKPFFSSQIKINNKIYPSAQTITNYLYRQLKQILKGKKINQNLADICTPKKKHICLFHGDLCFSNIFIDDHNKTIKCIDPRGSFANNKMYGDILFDYAKITQSALGLYDLVIEDKYNLKYEIDNIEYELQLPKNYQMVKTKFTNFIPQKYRKQIRLIEALQFLSMIPWHADKPNRQIIFLCIGVQLFCRYIGGGVSDENNYYRRRIRKAFLWTWIHNSQISNYCQWA